MDYQRHGPLNLPPGDNQNHGPFKEPIIAHSFTDNLNRPLQPMKHVW
jgi:hypothetical protein